MTADTVNTKGCFEGPSGVLTIDGKEYGYTYTPEEDNLAGRTM